MKNRKENDAASSSSSYSSIDDLDSPSLEDKRQKVKIHGRRLRKVMVNDDGEEDDEFFDVKSDLSTAVSEFKSHNPVKKHGKIINGVGQSRNILGTLRSLFEKEKHPTKQLAVPYDSVINERLIEQKAAKISENAYVENTKPSFASNQSDSSPKVAATTKEHTDGVYAKNQVRKGLSTESSIRHQQNKNVKDNDDDDDVYDADCVVTSSQKFVQEVDDRHGKLGQDFDDSSNIHTLNDESKDSSSEDEVPFSLNHPKFRFSLPSKIANKLYPHQLEGLKWLWSLHCKGKGGILADDMGLGKTMLICGFLAGLFHSNLIKRVLIVVPKTLLPHWMKELGMVDLSRKTRVYAGTCATARQYELQRMPRDKGVLLTTYDIVRHNVKSLYDAVTWDYMILDEGHLIKNPRTKRAKSLQVVPCAHRIIISGTPLQNNLKELWALFNFCCPDLLGNKKRFKVKYEKPILRGNNKNASDRQKLHGSVAAQDLRSCIQPYFLRRLKTDVFREDGGTNTAKVSKKDEIIVWLRLSSCQRQLYEAFLNKRSVLYDSPLPAITILKKLCDHSLLLTKRAAKDVLEGMEAGLNQEDHWFAKQLAMHIAGVAAKYDIGKNHDSLSCKISFIMSLLNNLIPEGHNVLIFSQTRQMLNLLQDTLTAQGYKFLRIDGTTKACDRIKIVNDFQEGIGAPIFLLTSKVGGLGLTLTKADRVIVVDPAWNPSTDSQSVDRAYRIGQKKDVLVYRLMTCGTVEEKIYRTQIYKAGLFKSATEHKDPTRYFSYQDLKDLFSLPEQGFDISLTQQQLNEEHDHKYKMDSSLEAHIKFLESLGIAGISYHSLLFSKMSPVPVLRDEELTRIRQSIFRNARFAFNRKNVAWRKNMSRNVNKLSESKINCISQAYANKAVEARLQKHHAKLSSELHKLRMFKLRYYLKFVK